MILLLYRLFDPVFVLNFVFLKLGAISALKGHIFDHEYYQSRKSVMMRCNFLIDNRRQDF